MPSPQTVIYRVSAQDILLSANEEWDRFAAANESVHLLREKVLGRPLWEFISDEMTGQIYLKLLQRARAGHRLRFPFRCDSPAMRRRMMMTLVPGPEPEQVEFQSRIVAEEPRAPQPLLGPAGARSEELVRLCGWCKKIEVSGRWLEVEEAIPALGLFEGELLPQVTHAMCQDCFTVMSEAVEVS